MTGPTRADGEPSLSYLEPTQTLPWVKPAPWGVEWMLGVGRENQWGLVKGMRQEVLVVPLTQVHKRQGRGEQQNDVLLLLQALSCQSSSR